MALDNRKGRILQAVVEEYVETAEPVGSEWLAVRYDFGCRSATLRNEMAEMAEHGYLAQPHTSAGRVPTDRGYRYYVDRLMSPVPLPPADEQSQLAACEGGRLEVEEIVQRTCRLLADMTQCLSVATPPLADAAYLHRLYLTPATPRHALIVLLLSTGHVEHRLLELGAVPSEPVLQRLANYLNAVLAGREVAEIGRSAAPEPPAELARERVALTAVFEAVAAAAAGLTDDRLFLEGTSHILRQHEFRDVLRLEQLLAALQQRSVLAQVFGHILPGEPVTVLIGHEGPVAMMHECSVVTSRYWIRDRTGGYIGVVGPTRMQYARAVAAVELMARSLSDVLTRTSLG